jgi:hypothetical protein
MEALLAIGCIVAYFLAIPVMATMPTFGYLMSWPLRLALPFTSYAAAGDSIEGVFYGAGLSLILSFEHSICWKLGILALVAPSLWPSVV